MNNQLQLIDHLSFWGQTISAIPFLHKLGLIDFTMQDFDDEQKKAVYDPRRGTTTPLQEKRLEIIDLLLNNNFLCFIYEENYEVVYVYERDATLQNVLDKENYKIILQR